VLAPAVIDTNVVVARLVTADQNSPPARILNAMLNGKLIHLMSEELIAEYAEVMLRSSIASLNQLTDADIDALLIEIVANSVWRKPVSDCEAPDPDDDHLWRLLASQSDSILVTGDKLLLSNPLPRHSIISSRDFVALLRI